MWGCSRLESPSEVKDGTKSVAGQWQKRRNKGNSAKAESKGKGERLEHWNSGPDHLICLKIIKTSLFVLLC